jgi:chaperonin cofactor prefoldin
MDARRLLTMFTLTLVALVAVPAVASAKTVEFRGVVSGSPYGASNGYMAVPVLFSKQTAQANHLKSPVGLLVVRRALRVALPSGTPAILPVNLRAGDRFKGKVPMKSSYAQSFYPRVTFSSVSVYFRSAELSLAEISAAIDALRKATADLQAQLNSLKASSIKAFQDIYAQLEELKKAIAALQGLQVPNFQSQIDALNKRIDDLIASLPDFSKFALLTDLPDLSQYVKLSDLSSLLGSNTVITTLQTQVSALQSTVSSLTTQVTTLTTRLNNVCTALNTATIDPDGAGPLGSIGVISLPGITSVNACGP